MGIHQAGIPADIRDLLLSSDIPVGAWVSPPPGCVGDLENPNFITEHSYQLAKDSGITILYGLYENIEQRSGDALVALDCAQRNGMYYLACSSGIAMGQSTEAVQNTIRQFGANAPAYLGVLAFDEPAESQFDQLCALSNHYRLHHPDKLFYVNLLPYCARITQIQNHKSDESGPATTKEEYLHYIESYIQKTNPLVLSFDNYPCLGDFPSMEDHYFLNLSMICAAARRHSLPAWCFIQTCSWSPRVRIPGEAEILWQVNTALAYGIRGIQYFTFWQPLADGTWQGAMISPSGEILPQYDYVCHANRQIQLCQHPMHGSEFQGLLVFGDSPAPIPEEDILTDFSPISTVSGDIPLLIGCYRKGEASGLYVVNNSLEKSGHAAISFCKEVNLQLYHLDGCEVSQTTEASISLAPGAAAYLSIR